MTMQKAFLGLYTSHVTPNETTNITPKFPIQYQGGKRHYPTNFPQDIMEGNDATEPWRAVNNEIHSTGHVHLSYPNNQSQLS